jgi:hypothetical protein
MQAQPNEKLKTIYRASGEPKNDFDRFTKMIQDIKNLV